MICSRGYPCSSDLSVSTSQVLEPLACATTPNLCGTGGGIQCARQAGYGLSLTPKCRLFFLSFGTRVHILMGLGNSRATESDIGWCGSEYCVSEAGWRMEWRVEVLCQGPTGWASWKAAGAGSSLGNVSLTSWKARPCFPSAEEGSQTHHLASGGVGGESIWETR